MTDAADDLYAKRFPDEAVRAKVAIWRPIAAYLQRFVDASAPILDIACDRGYFIQNIRAAERWATDARDMSAHLTPDIRFVRSDGLALGSVVPTSHFGTVFMSNYLEHLPSADAVIEQFRVVAGLLRPGGRVVVLQPNIRFVGAAYWDFIDHRTPLTEHSLTEAAALANLRTVTLIPRFLPYTTRSALPQRPGLVRLYLRFPLAWRLLGRQTLYVGERA